MNLKITNSKSKLFVILLYFLFFGVTFFSGSSLESQLNLTGGVRFPVPNSIVVVLFFGVVVYFMISGITYPKGDRYLNWAFLYLFVILMYKFALLMKEGESLLNAFKSNTFTILTLFIFYLFFIVLGREKYLKLAMTHLVFFSVLGASIGWAMMFLGEVDLFFTSLVQFNNYPRLYSWFGNPNIMATTMAIAFLACIYNKNKTNILLTLFIFVSLLATGSKGVILAVVFTISNLVVFKCFFIKRTATVGIRKIMILSILLLLSWLVYVNFHEYLYSSIFRLNADDISSASGRVDIWERAFYEMNMMSSWDVLFGVGYGTFSEDFSKSAHSYYIKTLYEDGLIFLILFLAFTILTMIQSIIDFLNSKDCFYIFFLSLTLFLLTRGLTSPTFFQDKLEAYLYMVFLIPIISHNKRCKV